MTERSTNPEITKKLVKTHSKNDTHTTKDHLTSVDKKRYKSIPQVLEIKSSKLKPKDKISSEQPASCVQPPIK